MDTINWYYSYINTWYESYPVLPDPNGEIFTIRNNKEIAIFSKYRPLKKDIFQLSPFFSKTLIADACNIKTIQSSDNIDFTKTRDYIIQSLIFSDLQDNETDFDSNQIYYIYGIPVDLTESQTFSLDITNIYQDHRYSYIIKKFSSVEEMKLFMAKCVAISLQFDFHTLPLRMVKEKDYFSKVNKPLPKVWNKFKIQEGNIQDLKNEDQILKIIEKERNTIQVQFIQRNSFKTFTDIFN